jgi:hypothetical protein
MPRTHSGGVVFENGFDIKHNAHGFHDKLDTRGRILQASNFNNVVATEVLEASNRFIERGQRRI